MNEKKEIAYVEGVSQPINRKDIVAIYNENQAKFNEEYEGKKVNFTGTIRNITSNINNSNLDKIVFKEGWEVEIPSGACKKISQLKENDIVEVSSMIAGVFGNTVIVNCYTIKTNSIKQYRINSTSIKLDGEELCTMSE